MKPNSQFLKRDLSFWSNVKLLNQRIGYHERVSKKTPDPDFVVPTIQQIKEVFIAENLDYSLLINPSDRLTKTGRILISYFEFRKTLLNTEVKPNLLDANSAKALFEEHKARLHPKCPLPLNKQSDEKKDYAFLTGLVNMMIEEYAQGLPCDYDPRELTAITRGGFPVRTLSRRIDGAFPSAINPLAIWEIKEYYYTTTFGSRIADGVYETMLDGYELKEISENLGVDVKHYLFIDAYLTWWGMGKSYLCRMVDILHMGLVDEIIVGKEVVTRLPELVSEWVEDLSKR